MVLQQVATAASAFAATNLDDLVILVLFFSRLNAQFRAVHVVSGQALGFAVLVLVSLLGFLGQALLPQAWLGLLGLLPISLGVSRLMELLEVEDGGESPDRAAGPGPGAATPLADVVGVAAVTVANGSDNIGVYLPLFARASASELAVTLVTFALGVALWCAVAWRLTQVESLAPVLRPIAGPLIPLVLIGLGTLILVDSHTFDHRALALFALACIGVMLRSIARLLQSQLQSQLVGDGWRWGLPAGSAERHGFRRLTLP